MLSEQVEFDLGSMATSEPRPTTRPQRSSGRIPYLVSTLLILGGALLASISWANYDRTQQTLVLANDIAAGEPITVDDLKLLRTKGVTNRLSDSSELIGQTANTDLVAGEIILGKDVAAGPSLKIGEAVIGLTLKEGDYPSVGIKVGDYVNVVGPVPAGGSDVIGRQLKVVDVSLSTTGALNVSLLTYEDIASEFTNSGAENAGIRLVLVGKP